MRTFSVRSSLQHLRVGILGGDGAVFRDDLVGQRFQLLQLFRRQLLVKIQDDFVFAQMKAHVGAAIQAVGQTRNDMLPGVALHPAEAQGPVQVPFHLCSRLQRPVHRVQDAIPGFLHIQDVVPAQRSPVGRLAAAFREKGRLVQLHLPLALPGGGAGADGGSELFSMAILVI